MSEPYGDRSNLTVEDAALKQSFTLSEADDFLPDTSSYFETWIEKLKPDLGPPLPPPENSTAAQLKFEGTLWVDSYLAYLLQSQTGTLIVSETGEVDADIVAAVVIIDGLVRGNICASERVELQSHALVIGDIESPAVAIQPGAVFEGQCRGNKPPQNGNGSDRIKHST
jgi:cytoskeletal protein CcmA (bactofilin family)